MVNSNKIPLRVEENVRFHAAYALDLPFADCTFDFARARAMRVLVKDQKRVIEEVIRIIKTGGYAGNDYRRRLLECSKD